MSIQKKPGLFSRIFRRSRPSGAQAVTPKVFGEPVQTFEWTPKQKRLIIRKMLALRIVTGKRTKTKPERSKVDREAA